MIRHTLLIIVFSLVIISCGKKSEDGERCSLDGSKCAGGTGTTEVQTGGAVQFPALTCTAQSTKAIYAHNETVGITITGKGGSGSYAVPQFVSSFSGSTTIYIGGYKNFGTTDRAVEKSVYITDSIGNITSCAFKFTVTPSAGASGLACGITPSKLNPMVGESVNFAVKATGGATPYTFSQFYPRQGESPKNLSTISGGDASVSHSFAWIGFADPAVKVTDANGSSVWCEIPNRYMAVLPRTTPKIFASVTSSNVDADGTAVDSKNLYKVSLTVSGFSGTNQIDYSSLGTESGVSVSQNQAWTGDNVFFVKRLDNLTHDFTLQFKADAGDGQTATTSVNIKFGDYLACKLDAPVYIFQGQESFFTVNAYSGEAVNISDVVASSGIGIRQTTSGNAGVLGLTFGTQGYYEVRFKAKSRVDALKYCNGKAEYIVDAWVLPPPSTLTGCQVIPNVTSAQVGAPIHVDIKRSGGVTDMNGYVISLTPNGSNTLNAGPYINGPDTASFDIRLNETKTYLLTASVREVSTGKTVSCQTYVESYNRPGLLAEVFDVPHVNGALANFGSATQIPALNHIVENINVSARRSDCSDRKHSHLHKYGHSDTCEYPGVYGRKEWFGVRYTGKIVIPVTGTYNFKFTVDDGVSLEIDGTSVIWFDGLHSPSSTQVGSRYLTAGEHTIKVHYFQGPAWEVANVFQWKIPGSVWSIVPAGSFRQP